MEIGLHTSRLAGRLVDPLDLVDSLDPAASRRLPESQASADELRPRRVLRGLDEWLDRLEVGRGWRQGRLAAWSLFSRRAPSHSPPALLADALEDGFASVEADDPGRSACARVANRSAVPLLVFAGADLSGARRGWRANESAIVPPFAARVIEAGERPPPIRGVASFVATLGSRLAAERPAPCGVLLTLGGRRRGLEFVAYPELFVRLLPELLLPYAIEAQHGGSEPPPGLHRPPLFDRGELLHGSITESRILRIRLDPERAPASEPEAAGE